MLGLIRKARARGLKSLSNRGFDNGIAGSGIWLGIALVAGGLRLMGRIGKRKEKIVYTTELVPGQQLVIDHLLETRGGTVVKQRRK